jgi:hypothetical protein
MHLGESIVEEHAVPRCYRQHIIASAVRHRQELGKRGAHRIAEPFVGAPGAHAKGIP